MDRDSLNTIINNYVRDNLSPKPDQRDYISAKYKELRTVLSRNCFQTGSYARFTAIHPVHDLDVIYVVDPTVYDDPAGCMLELKKTLEQSGITNLKEVSAQTHSVTITFTDSEPGFGIDVVPAIETNETDEFDKPIYIVPEILEVNKYNRTKYYKNSEQPVEWIKSDPRGYVKAARVLNESTKNFRHASKLGKGWRHACKMAYKDEFRFKSFHFELMFFDYFSDNPTATTLEAVIDCMNNLSSALDEPQFPDRADSSKYIDQYVVDLSDEEKQLILSLQADTSAVLAQLEASRSESQAHEILNKLLSVSKQATVAAPAASTVVPTRQPWAT